ncbi:isochorismatase family protein [Streptomyces collinus]|uniref:cysteine hydrolase family protein n=1 Tax=Streptomyces collinus TaxID=42684 RepID=UPI0033B90205
MAPTGLCLGLGRRPNEVVIRKPSYGAFYDTPLDTMLRILGRDTVIVMGKPTNYCCGPGRHTNVATRSSSAPTSRQPTTNPGKNLNAQSCVGVSPSC